jgi:hypothetical protein
MSTAVVPLADVGRCTVGTHHRFTEAQRHRGTEAQRHREKRFLNGVSDYRFILFVSIRKPSDCVWVENSSALTGLNNTETKSS